MKIKRAVTSLVRRKALVVAVASCFAGYAQANPTGPAVMSGAATFALSGKTLSVTNTPGTIINWQGFSVKADEVTRFIQQNAQSAVLNRVITQEQSAILGQLLSNGRVYLVNPNGITIGASARIDTSGFVASSLNLSDKDALAGKFKLQDTGTSGKVINNGTITTSTGGFVYLVAPDVENNGVIMSPKGEIVLAAGKSVELVDSQKPELRVLLTAPENTAVNVGKMIAEAGTIGIFAGAIRQSGLISANSAVVGENGKIMLKAKKDITLAAGSKTEASGPQGGSVTIQSESGTTIVAGTVEAKATSTPTIYQLKEPATALVSVDLARPPEVVPVTVDLKASNTLTMAGKGGSISILGNLVGLIDQALVDASGEAGGGQILVGGDFQGKNPDVQNAQQTYVGKDVQLIADAVLKGDGGKVVVWADNATNFVGSLSARGGEQGGNGGFAEVSGKDYLYFDPRGALDLRAPKGITGTLLLDPNNVNIVDSTLESLGGGTFGGTPSVFSNATATSSTLRWSTITGQLGTANVIITTSGTAALPGNITVSDGYQYTSANSLTLLANNDITVTAAADVSGTNKAGITNLGAGGISLLSGWNGASTSAPVLTGAGTVTLSSNVTTSGGAITITGGSVSATGAIASNGNSAVAGGAVTINANGTAAAGNVTLAALSTNGTGSGGAISISGNNAVTLNGAINAGDSTVLIKANQDGTGSQGLTMASGSSITTANIGTGASAAVMLYSNNGAGSGVGTGDITVRDIATGSGGEIQIISRFGAATDQEVHGNILYGGSGTLVTGPTGTVNLITGAGKAGDPTGGAGSAIATNAGKLSIGASQFNVANAIALTDLSTAIPITGSAIAASNRIITAPNLTYTSSSTASAHTLTAMKVSSGNLNAGFGAYYGALTIDDGAVSLGSGNFAVSGNGAITRGTGTNPVITTTGVVTLNTSGGIGSLATPLTINAGSFNAQVSGGVFVNHTGTGTLNLVDYNSGGFYSGGNEINIAAAGPVAIQVNPNAGSGALNISAVGAITQSAAIVNSGTATFTAGAANDITLTNVANNFGTVAVTSGKNVSITDTNALVLGASTISGDFAVSAGGSITTSGALALNGVSSTIAATGSASDITISNAITHSNASASTLTLQADRDVIFGGSGSAVSSLGALGVTLNSDRTPDGAGAIVLNSGSSITSNGGDVVLGGGANPLTVAAQGTAANPNGVLIDGALVSSGAGKITITGQQYLGGTAIAGGVTIQRSSGGAPAMVQSTTGDIVISGTGGTASSPGGNNGVYLWGHSAGAGLAGVHTSDGNITIGGSVNPAGNGYGVWLRDGAKVDTSGAGNIAITGSGGALGSNDIGVIVSGSSGTTAPSSVEATGSGNITITGTGGGIPTGSGSYGFNIGNAISKIDTSAGTGSITITATGGSGSGGNNAGIRVQGAKISTSSGNVGITATSIGSGAGSDGVQLGEEGSTSSGGVIEATGSGNITIAATAGSGGIGINSDVTANTNRIGSGTMTGAITLNADSFGITTHTNIFTGASGKVTVAPKTAATAIQVGNTATNRIDFGSNSFLTTNILTGTLQVGDANAGAITVAGAFNPGHSIVSLVSGGAIDDIGSKVITAATGVRLVGTSIGATSGIDTNTATLAASASGAGGALKVINAGALNIASVDGTSGITTNGGAVTLTAGGALALASNNVSGAGVTLNGAGVTSTGGIVDGGAGDVLVNGGGGAINLAGALNTTSATATAVTVRNATTVALGNINTGPAGVTGTTVLGVGNDITGAVTQTGVIHTGTLTGSTGALSGVTLDSPNVLTNLGAFAAGAGLTVNDSTLGLNVTGAVNGGTGLASIATTGGALAVTTGSVSGTGVTLASTNNDVTLNGAVNGGAGTVTLTAGGLISQTATGTINAGTLTGSAGTTATLGQGNTIANLGAFAAGAGRRAA
ncbi:MAG: filamentous hemagglutinin N-terminal domain-containing protein [Proteobacteria bacterium]|nr:filamentous hemagglutinin N-terminal domain-containing protein [Pseudomonadota bacterium]